MLQHADCPTKYWGLAMHTVVYLHNRLPAPTASNGSGGVPYTILHGVPNDLAEVTVFRCTAYLRLEDRYRYKLSPKTFRCIFIGYYGDGHESQILNFARSELVRSTHVAFVESPPAHASSEAPVAYGTFQPSPPNGLEQGGAPMPIFFERTLRISQP
jgi:hypothetical protein